MIAPAQSAVLSSEQLGIDNIASDIQSESHWDSLPADIIAGDRCTYAQLQTWMIRSIKPVTAAQTDRKVRKLATRFNVDVVNSSVFEGCHVPDREDQLKRQKTFRAVNTAKDLLWKANLAALGCTCTGMAHCDVSPPQLASLQTMVPKSCVSRSRQRASIVESRYRNELLEEAIGMDQMLPRAEVRERASLRDVPPGGLSPAIIAQVISYLNPRLVINSTEEHQFLFDAVDAVGEDVMKLEGFMLMLSEPMCIWISADIFNLWSLPCMRHNQLRQLAKRMQLIREYHRAQMCTQLLRGSARRKCKDK